MIRDFYEGAMEPLIFALLSLARLIYGGLCLGFCCLVTIMFAVMVGAVIHQHDPAFNGVDHFSMCMGISVVCIVTMTGLCNIAAKAATRRGERTTEESA